MLRRLVIAAVAVFCQLGLAHAQAFPERNITLVVPFPAGGSTDAVARIIAERMQTHLGVSVIIENVGGAGGSTAVGRVSRTTPDGYTVSLGQWDTMVGNIVYKLNYDLEKDFTHIGMVSINPQLLIARKSLPANDLPSLIAYIKANSKNVRYVNQNSGAKLSGIQLQNITGSELQFVPYRGAGPAMNDMLAEQVDLITIQAAGALPHVQAGTLKAIVNLSPARSATIPDIPVPSEYKVEGIYMSGWFGLFGPKGMPSPIVAALQSALAKTLADPIVPTRFAQLGIDVASPDLQTPEGFARYHRQEIDKWWPIIKAAGITADN
jgi:tripartite-type tricarboxylate transporter receptor subunit TctC